MPGTRCTVGLCNNSHAKTKHLTPRISYHKFPINQRLRAEWIQRCRRAGDWNPKNCHVCSIHFKKDDFEADIKNIVLGLPQKNILKNDAVPTQHLGLRLLQELRSSERNQRMVARQNKSFIEEVIAEKNKPLFSDVSKDDRADPAIRDDIEASTHVVDSVTQVEDGTEILEARIQQLLTENTKLKTEFDLYKTNARSTIRRLQNQVKYLKSKKHTDKAIHLVIKQTLSCVLSNNQLDIILSKKKRVNWTAEEISIAFTLRYFSKRCYIYLRKNLRYPLPGLSTLQAHAAKINMRQGVLDDVLNFMHIAGRDMTPGEKLVVIQFDEVKVKEK